MFKPIPISPLIMLLAAGGILVVFFLLFIINWRNAYLRKHYESAVLRMESDLQKKDDELDSLFVQLLHWRELAEEYKKLMQEFLPLAENNSIIDALTDLHHRFEHLYHLTESDRKKYMEKMAQQDGYSAAYQKVVDYLVNKMTGLNTGMKAEETPILNLNREN